jgi:hypothetical protein
MQIHSVGIDLGKTTFHLVALGAAGKVIVKKKFTRKQLLMYTANMQTFGETAEDRRRYIYEPLGYRKEGKNSVGPWMPTTRNRPVTSILPSKRRSRCRETNEERISKTSRVVEQQIEELNDELERISAPGLLQCASIWSDLTVRQEDMRLGPTHTPLLVE